MRMSFAYGLVVLACIAALGSGCNTAFGRWLGLSSKKPVPAAPTASPTLTPEIVPMAPDGGSLLEPGEEMIAEIGTEPFDKSRTPDTEAAFAPVQFAYDSFVIPPPEISKIEQVGQFLLENASRVLVVEGNCDERGSNEYNLSLGEQRAGAVRKYLIDLGIDGLRVQTKSFGEEKPADTGHNEAAWAKNRRAEFVVYK
jgi:peptidoglycan-associated lipoprotein